MKIEQSQIHLNSARVYERRQTLTENLQVWVGERPQPETGQPVLLDISKEALALLGEAEAAPAQPVGEVENEEELLSDEDQLKLRLLEHMLSAMTGKRVRLKVPRINLKDLKELEISGYTRGGQPLQGRQSAGWGMVYDRRETLKEYEKTEFAAAGTVRTADGREIQLNVSLKMERSYAEERSVSLRAGDALKDPLVLNFGGNAAGLSTRTFAFDIDADGREDQISLLQSGSGFLALDRNGNGAIDNGTELFGPQTDAGFSELQAHDADGNAWIDENDPIFSKLRVWMKDDAGNDRLLALGEAGVGAIYLGHVSTEFTLRQLDVQGRIRESGIFLKENGQVGTVQELDLKV